MKDTVDAVLAYRWREVTASSRARVGGSLLVHLGLAAAAALAPLLAARGAEPPPEFVPVYVVPAAALGVLEPTPAPARPEPRPPQPDPEPEPRTPPAPDEPEPEPEAAPVMAAPEARPQPRPQRPEPPAAAPAGGELGRRQGQPTGASTGTAAFGGASLSLADQNFTYGYYINQMLAMIQAQWSRPALGGQVQAAVFFRIGRGGEVSDVRIVESSGFNAFDLAGLRAVRQAAPFPRLPESYPRNELAVKLILQ